MNPPAPIEAGQIESTTLEVCRMAVLSEVDLQRCRDAVVPRSRLLTGTTPGVRELPVWSLMSLSLLAFTYLP